jgi:hypothetical protein
LGEGWNPIQSYWRDPSKANREALRAFLKPETTFWQYTHGAPDPSLVSPDGYSLDNFYRARPGVEEVEVQLDLFGDYKSNVALYPTFQNYFRTHSRPCLPRGARTIPSSCRRARRRSSATSQALLSSRSRPMRRKSRRRFATSSGAEFSAG